MKPWTFIGIGILTIGTLAGVTWAGDASKADMDFCNQKAARGSKPNSPYPGARMETAPSGVPSSGNITGTPVSPGPSAQPGTGSPQPGQNPTGGRVTDDGSQPETSRSARGMAPAGETDSKYRQAYLACLNERTK